MLTDDSKINGLPIRAEIRMPLDEGNVHWLSSVVICQDTDKGTFVVWSVWHHGGHIEASNGLYDIPTYEYALARAYSRATA